MDTQVAIIGSGPAGLAAALTLSRSMIGSVVFDEGKPFRNASSPFVAALPGMDKTTPAELRSTVRKEILSYPFARFEDAGVSGIRRIDNGFELSLENVGNLTAETLLLATGMVDLRPPLKGFEHYWGRSIINCPFCHGIEWRDRTWGIYAQRPEVLAAAEIYRNWTPHLTYFIDREMELQSDRRALLVSMGIKLEEALPVEIHGANGNMTHVELPDGRAVRLDCLLVYPYQKQVNLIADAQVALGAGGSVEVDEGYRTSVPGIYAAGDLIYEGHQNTPTALYMGNMAAATMVMDYCFRK
ncbi:NAD(P)/FAD-dependent oxidoreductase [Roseibium marinum]|uniref:Thioredoxin reductase n=1 Tax=Roseibium marinum TaxID=281252 RepID=A0A2S3UNQ3_9HYPH|nr:NAD(P)/FAD-dependent oxidoreductase [Roseibium marinum]POF29304.1 thioredoxin reductase [Roseibium marinum]